MFIEVGSGKPMLSPEKFLDGKSYPDKGIMIFTKNMANAVRELTNLNYDLKQSNKPYKIKYLDDEITLLYPFFGAPATIVAFEIASAYGLTKMIAVGEAGAIHPKVKITDYILPRWGVREEGTSYHYMPIQYTPRINNKLHETLLNNLRREGYRVHVGSVWTTDAIFRETTDKIEKYRDIRVLCVDMESTALMSVAEYRSVEIAILLVASDELYHDIWVSGWETEKLKEAEYNAVETVLNTIAKYKHKNKT